MTERQSSFYRLAPHIIDFSVDEKGSIQFGERHIVRFHTPMFATLFEKMKDVAGPVIGRKIKEFGHQAGHDIAEGLSQELKESNLLDVIRLLFKSSFDVKAVKDIAPKHDLAQMEKIFGIGTYNGWMGDVSIEEYEEEDHALFTASNTFESVSHGETGEKECHFITGVVEGMISYFWDKDVTAEEKQCACEGHEYCQIAVTAHDE